jgi:hypothetical protein
MSAAVRMFLMCAGISSYPPPYAQTEVSIRNQPYHVAFQVSTYLRVGIFAEDQGGAGMVDKYIA